MTDIGRRRLLKALAVGVTFDQLPCAGAEIPVATPTALPNLPADGVVAFKLTTRAVTGTYPFSVGVALKKGDATTIRTQLDSAQIVVKRRWTDNSIKHAIISGRVRLVQNQPLTVTLSRGKQALRASLTALDIANAAPAASVQCESIGTVNLIDLLGRPFRTWISGPEMVECHYRGTVGTDVNLVAWFHVRLFVDGRIWVRTICENGFLDNGAGELAPKVHKYYVPLMRVGETIVFHNGGRSLAHYMNTRYCAEGWIGGDPSITPTFNVQYLRDAKILPNYHWTSPSEATLNSQTQLYTQMRNGQHERSMGAAGFQYGIGLLPNWEALWAASGDARAYQATLANSSHGNSYPICWRSKLTGLVIDPDDFATWSTGGPGAGVDITRNSAGDLTWDYHHHPSMGWLGYLLTGDYWHYETMVMQCAMIYLNHRANSGRGTARLFRSSVRGGGWMVRSYGQYAAVAPDGDELAEKYRSLLLAQFTYYRTRFEAPGASKLGYVLHAGPKSAKLPYSVSPWMYHFQMQANGYVYDLEPGFSDDADFVATRDFQYKGIVGILGPAGTENYCFNNGSKYDIVISDVVKASFQDLDLQTEQYKTWGEVYRATFGASNTSCGSMLAGSLLPTAYWANLMPAIAYAVDHGAPGGQDAWNRVVGASNWPKLRDSGFDNTPVWGILPRSRKSTASWRHGQAIGEWRQIPGSAISLAPFKTNAYYSGQNGPYAKVDAWTGWCIDTRTSEVYSALCGGHGSYFGNEVDVIDLEADAPAWREILAPSSAADVAASMAIRPNRPYYVDGRPAARHNYYASQFIESLGGGRVMSFGAPAISRSGDSFLNCDGFNPATNAWDAPGTYPNMLASGQATAWATCKHPVTEDVYVWAGGSTRIQKWTKTANRWSYVGGSTPVNGTSAASAIDPKRNLLFLTNQAGANYTFDLSTFEFTARALTGSPAAQVTGPLRGMIYEPQLDRYLYRRPEAGGSVYVVNPESWEVAEMTTTGGSAIPPALGPIFPMSVLTRWLYVPRLGGVVYGPRWGPKLHTGNPGENLWFLRTH